MAMSSEMSPPLMKDIFFHVSRALAEMEKSYPKTLVNFHMGYVQEDHGEETEQEGNCDENILLLYQLDPGPSSSSFGLNVARLAGVHPRLIGEAKVLAAYMEAKKKRNAKRRKEEKGGK